MTLLDGLFAATALLLALAWVTGGGSRDRGWGDAITQLIALPVLLTAWTVALQGRLSRWSRVALAVALLVPAAVALQLLPLPGFLQAGGPARSGLLADLQLAGLAEPGLGASLSPWATERSLWALLPAVAMFSAVLVLPTRRRQELAWLLVGLVGFSLLLGLLQLGAPQTSPLNPFPELRPAMAGVFANPNHQATGLTIGLVLLLSWLSGARRDAEVSSRRRLGQMMAVIGLAVLFLAALPLTGSRAMVLIAGGALLATPVLTGWLGRRLQRNRRGRLRLALVSGGAVAAVLLLVAVTSWIRVDVETESRAAVAAATMAMAGETMPWGVGVGSFVPWFDAHAPEPLVQYSYFNHAHNEYVQWWLESGIAGIAWILLLAAGLLATFPRAWLHPRNRHSHVAVGSDDWLVPAAWLAIAVVLAHSLVDYPLRTPAVMTATALLAAIVVSGSPRQTVTHSA